MKKECIKRFVCSEFLMFYIGSRIILLKVYMLDTSWKMVLEIYLTSFASVDSIM